MTPSHLTRTTETTCTQDPRCKATIVKPEQALPIKSFSFDMKVLLTSEAAGGALSVIMGWLKPGEGPPDHVHSNQEELFFTLPGGQDRYFKAIAELAGGGGFTDEKAMEISKKFDTNFPAAH